MPFWGSSKEPEKPDTASPSSEFATMDSLSTANLSSFSGNDAKTKVMNELRQTLAVENARKLIEKVNEQCFARCVPKPGPSFTSGEEQCFSSCMEKYLDAWNTVSKQYISTIQKAQKMPELVNH